MSADLDLIRRAANQMREGDDVRWARKYDRAYSVPRGLAVA